MTSGADRDPDRFIEAHATTRSLRLRRVRGVVPLITWVLVLASLPLLHGLRVRATRTYFANLASEEVYYLPPPSWLRILDLGFHEMTADLIWIRALVYTGTRLSDRGAASYVLPYARAMATLDPTWTRPYLWAPNAVAFQVIGTPVASHRAAAEFAAEGARRFPDDGTLAWNAGAYLSYELAPALPIGSPERAEAKRRGLEWMVVAARQGAGPPWLALANAAELTRSGDRALARLHLEEMLALTDDPEIRAELASRIQHLDATASVGELQNAGEVFERSRLERSPYLPPGLFFLLGPALDLDP